MIHDMQLKILDKIPKWLKSKKVIIVLLCAIFFTSAGVFSMTVWATDNETGLKDNMSKAYFVHYDGHNIGAVKEKAEIESVLTDIQNQFKAKYQMEVKLIHDIDYEEIYIEDRFLSDIHDLKKIVQTNTEVKVKAAVIQVNGQDLAILKDMETAQSILDSLQQPFKDKAEESGVELEEIRFEEDVKIKDEYVEYENLEDPDVVQKRFTEGDVEKQIYVVQKGDNIWTIAMNHDMTVREILEANAPMEESDILQIGQELNLNVPELPINILTVEEIEYTKSIPFETETKKTDTLYTNQTKVSQEGQKGEMLIVAKVYKRNGVENNRETISETITKQPVKKIVLQGTKKPVKNSTSSRSGSSSTSSSGTLSWPVSGRISSRFGSRWGRQHNGLDIATKKGTPVYAAASGTVSFSGYQGSFGNLVKIKHGGGLETYYAHLNSRAVSSGQSVKRGQLIGYVGSTGRSTGPHLHFEVRVNGTPKNPLNYLK